jgi:membrane-associated phospholipid phosphatase
LHVALADTVVAAWDAQTAFPPRSPAVAHGVSAGDAVDPDRSSYPSQHAAVAGAAATVLAYLFPAASSRWLDTLAEEAGVSRLWAGTNYRGDIDAGFALGRQIGALAVARGEGDGSSATWDGSGRPSGEGIWQPTPPGFGEPLDPLAGTWQPWLLGTGSAFRPAPPPATDSPGWHAELAAVQEATARRSPDQEEAVHYWAGGPGTVTPAGLWAQIARDLIVRDGLDDPHAARVLALVSAAMADAFICCWDAKFTYWTARPVTADPNLAVLIPTPPFPSYTSGHATISAAAATVLGHLFPGDADVLTDRAIEAKNSRLWAGIHFPIDNDMGATMGNMVGRLVIDRARADGA